MTGGVSFENKYISLLVVPLFFIIKAYTRILASWLQVIGRMPLLLRDSTLEAQTPHLKSNESAPGSDGSMLD